MKKALVCRVCDEVSWIHVSRLHTLERQWFTCSSCFRTRHDD